MKEFYKNKVLVAAHRGNSKYFPENTMSAFKSALTLDIDMIETDVHMTKDGELVIIHDHTVDRTTNGKGEIRNMTFEEIKRLDAGSWKGTQFENERVPSFREFLELVADKKDMMFNIELKDYPYMWGDFAYESCDKIIAMMEEYGIAERSVINSWSGQILEYIDKKYDKKYKLHGYFPLNLLGSYQTRDAFEYLYCICLFDKEKIVSDKENFDYAKSRGVEPWVFYAEEKPEIYRMAAERGAVLFTANDPAKADKILRELNAR